MRMKMTKPRIILSASALILILAGAEYFIFIDKPADNDTSTSSSSQTEPGAVSYEAGSSPASGTQSNVESTLIAFDGKSFSPSTITVKKGALVTIKNS